MRYHFLFLPYCHEKRPQAILDVQVIRLGLQLLANLNNPELSLGYNSTQAWSSVNHLHFQGIYSTSLSEDNKFPVCCHPTWPARFVQLKNKRMDQLAEETFVILTDYIEKNIAHNVLLTENGTKVFIFPREHHQQTNSHSIGIAIIELCGLITVSNREDFDTFTETHILSLYS